MLDPQIEPSWKKELEQEFTQPYFLQLADFVVDEIRQKKVIYPPLQRIFSAFDYTPFDRVKVVILGQDPYHGPKQANGLCFSVSEQVPIPPSLMNIYIELKNDLGLPIPTHGNLEKWAREGVLLLNSVLTVRQRSPASHAGKGWEQFTDRVIERISEEKENSVFLLWGKYAREKGNNIDAKRHCVLSAPHPSPFSASHGFFGCRHFSKANSYLSEHGQQPIDWRIE